MPIYMDRHYVEGATKNAVEKAHEQDLAYQDQFGVTIMTYWFDEARSTAFCLVDAPDEGALRELHACAHGLVPNEIIEVDPAIVQAFLGRIEDPPPAPTSTGENRPGEIDSAFRAIMFTDLQGSTQLAVQLGDEKAMHLLRIHNALTREALRAHNGREVKTTGDGFLLSFVSAADALECGIAIQEAFADYNKHHPEEALFVRIGLAAGEPIEERGDLYGAAVNLASRICDQAQAGSILVAKIICDQMPQMSGRFQFRPSGKMSLKGFDERVELFEVAW